MARAKNGRAAISHGWEIAGVPAARLRAPGPGPYTGCRGRPLLSRSSPSTLPIDRNNVRSRLLKRNRQQRAQLVGYRHAEFLLERRSMTTQDERRSLVIFHQQLRAHRDLTAHLVARISIEKPHTELERAFRVCAA